MIFSFLSQSRDASTEKQEKNATSPPKTKDFYPFQKGISTGKRQKRKDSTGVPDRMATHFEREAPMDPSCPHGVLSEQKVDENILLRIVSKFYKNRFPTDRKRTKRLKNTSSSFLLTYRARNMETRLLPCAYLPIPACRHPND